MRRIFEGRHNIIVGDNYGDVAAYERRWKWGFIPYSALIAEIDANATTFRITVYDDNEALGVFMESKIRSMVELNGKNLVLYFA
jgi:hypothetical protein